MRWITKFASKSESGSGQTQLAEDGTDESDQGRSAGEDADDVGTVAGNLNTQRRSSRCANVALPPRAFIRAGNSRAVRSPALLCIRGEADKPSGRRGVRNVGVLQGVSVSGESEALTGQFARA